MNKVADVPTPPARRSKEPLPPVSALAGTFGARLREFRVAKGLRQLDLAYAAGAQIGDISNYERGRSMPAFETLIDLAYALDIDAGDLVTGLQPDTPPTDHLGH